MTLMVLEVCALTNHEKMTGKCVVADPTSMDLILRRRRTLCPTRTMQARQNELSAQFVRVKYVHLCPVFSGFQPMFLSLPLAVHAAAVTVFRPCLCFFELACKVWMAHGCFFCFCSVIAFDSGTWSIFSGSNATGKKHVCLEEKCSVCPSR